MTAVRLRRPDLLACRKGGTAVEFALLLAPLTLLLFGGMEFGRIAWTLSTLNFAVQEAARCAAIGACPDVASTQARAASRASALNIPAADFAVAQQTCGWNVTANLTYAPLIKVVTKTPLTLTARACKS